MPTYIPFKTNITDTQLDSIDIETIKFIYDQAEKKLKDSLQSGDSIKTRSYNFIALLSSLLIALIVYLTKEKIVGNKIDVSVFGFAIFFILYILIVLVILFINVLTKKYLGMGVEPFTIFMQKYIAYTDAKDISRSVKYIYTTQIEKYQDRISLSVKSNEYCGKRLNAAIWMILGIIFIFFLYLSFSS